MNTMIYIFRNSYDTDSDSNGNFEYMEGKKKISLNQGLVKLKRAIKFNFTETLKEILFLIMKLNTTYCENTVKSAVKKFDRSITADFKCQ